MRSVFCMSSHSDLYRTVTVTFTLAVKCILSNSSFVLRLWDWGELQQGPRGPAGLSRGLALAGQPAACGLPPLWRSHHLPLLDDHCSTLCGQVRPSPRTSHSRGRVLAQLESALCCLSLCPLQGLQSWRLDSVCWDGGFTGHPV